MMNFGYLLKVLLAIATFAKPTVEQQTQYQNYSKDFKVIVTGDEYQLQVTFITQYWQHYIKCSVSRDWCKENTTEFNKELYINSTCSEERTEVTTPPVYPWSTTSEPSKAKTLNTLELTLIAVVGVLALLLVGVIIGWVWTCKGMKKRKQEPKEEQVRLDDSEGNNTSSNVRQLHNPTYTSSDSLETELEVQNGESSYEVVPPVPERSTSIRNKSPHEHNEHQYESIDRAQARHTNTPLRQKTSVEVKPPSRFSKQMQERRGENQEGEHHIYHVLEGPSTDV